MSAEKAIVLLSGGLDSTTAAAVAKQDGFSIHALTFDYGQRHRFELEAARRVAEFFGVAEHKVVGIDLTCFGGSALTADLDVPKGSITREGIPITYVPARNTIFLSYALAWAEVIGCCDIFIGVSAVDYSGYPDCRHAYIRAFEELANLATRLGVEGKKITLHAPLISLSKADIIKLGMRLGVDYSITHTCYDPDAGGLPCGQCEACLLRSKGFMEAGISDPLLSKPI